jgi:hypothetical protein
MWLENMAPAPGSEQRSERIECPERSERALRYVAASLTHRASR